MTWILFVIEILIALVATAGLAILVIGGGTDDDEY